MDDLVANIVWQFQHRFRLKLRRACVAAFRDAKATGASEPQVRLQIADMLQDANVKEAFESVFGDRPGTSDADFGLDEQYRPVCPKCNESSAVVPIYYGLLQRDEEAKKRSLPFCGYMLRSS